MGEYFLSERASMELSKQLPENVEGPLSEVQEVEAGVEELIAGAHGEEHLSVSR